MDEVEAVDLVRWVQALCPQQFIDSETYEAWFAVLHDYDFEACRDAATTCAGLKPFVAPAEIIAEVRRVQANRMKAYFYEPAPDETVREGIERRRAQARAVMAGSPPPEIAGRAGRPLLQLVPSEARPAVLPPDMAAVIGPLRHPAREVRCPKDSCGVRPGFSCRGGDRRVMPGGVHRERVARWSVERSACPSCGAGAGESCRLADDDGARWGVHDVRVDLAEREEVA